MRIRWFRCRSHALPALPKRKAGTNLPEWMRQSAQPIPVQSPGRAGWLTPGRQFRANGGRW
ncbi:hypothetical protein E1193_07945 [Micromonospora sp. KC606]|uniref:hypothetical protein n=1 Tax=Micromonospora sp. KC606 TaxID=2530379 RepID=UPI001049301A|nr:hypothetical protein [Micromonospora sp. KC606]TDC83715.1 hypothetical protein E1193_07945 [Micromonospora sp. KC606]